MDDNPSVNNISFNDSTDVVKYDPDYHRMCDYIGITDPKLIDNNTEKLGFVMNWAKGNNGDIVDALLKIRDIRRELGMQEVGETALKKIYMYIRLTLDSQKIEQEKSLLKSYGITSHGEHATPDGL
jgi:hypothetical protein